jgi:OmpA-OmpF porin, OOP family
MRQKRYCGLKWLAVCLAGLMVAGCAARENEALEQARATYAQAQSRPEVVANAPLVLREAGDTLRQAEQADEREETTHLAYLAERRTEIAIAVAEREEARKEAARLGQQQQQLLLEARESEVERARREAEARAGKLEEARQTAEMRAREAEEARARAEQARKEIEELQSELSDLRARPTERGIVLTLGDVLFEFNKAELLPGAQRSVDKLAEFLRAHPERQLRIEGHTDSIGSQEYNQKLSERRAEAVAQALQARGIAPGRMVTVGYGKLYPVASNDSPGGRQQNRRVEVVIVNPGEEAEKQGRTPAR